MYAARELFVSPKINLRKVNKSGGAFNIYGCHFVFFDICLNCFVFLFIYFYIFISKKKTTTTTKRKEKKNTSKINGFFFN